MWQCNMRNQRGIAHKHDDDLEGLLRRCNVALPQVGRYGDPDLRLDRVLAGANLIGLVFTFGWRPSIGPVSGVILTLSAAA